MLVDIWLGLYLVLFSFFDHYIQSSVQVGVAGGIEVTQPGCAAGKHHATTRD